MIQVIEAKDVQVGDRIYDSKCTYHCDPWLRVRAVAVVPTTFHLEGGTHVQGEGISTFPISH